jgi:hypothetical protein
LLDNRFTDDGEVVSLTRRPPFTPRNIHGTHFCYRLSRPQGHSAAGRIMSIEKSSDIGNRTSDLPACSIVSHILYKQAHTFLKLKLGGGTRPAQMV